MSWQLDRLIGQLMLVGDHYADPTCPCTFGYTDPSGTYIGENCIPKHLLAIYEYATETQVMTDNEDLRDILLTIADEARQLREKEKEKLCGKEIEQEDITNWARDKRKDIEEYSLACDLKETVKDASDSKPAFEWCSGGSCSNSGDSEVAIALPQAESGPVELCYKSIESSRELVTEALDKTAKEDIEYGVLLKGKPELVKGETSAIMFPEIHTPTFHTHPSNNINPSEQDYEEATKAHRPCFCIGTKQEIRCYEPDVEPCSGTAIIQFPHSEGVALCNSPGLTKSKFKVKSLDLKKEEELEGWIDTGSYLSAIPEEVASRLGLMLVPKDATIPIKLADGSEAYQPWAIGVVQLDTRQMPQILRLSSQIVIGASTLQSLMFKVNPSEEKLEPVSLDSSDPGRYKYRGYIVEVTKDGDTYTVARWVAGQPETIEVVATGLSTRKEAKLKGEVSVDRLLSSKPLIERELGAIPIEQELRPYTLYRCDNKQCAAIPRHTDILLACGKRTDGEVETYTSETFSNMEEVREAIIDYCSGGR